VAFAQRRNRLATHTSDRIPVVKRHMTVDNTLTLEADLVAPSGVALRCSLRIQSGVWLSDLVRVDMSCLVCPELILTNTPTPYVFAIYYSGTNWLLNCWGLTTCCTVCIVTRLRAGRSGVRILVAAEMVLPCSQTSSPTLGHIQPFVSWITGLFPGGKAVGRDVDDLHPAPSLRNSGAVRLFLLHDFVDRRGTSLSLPLPYEAYVGN